MKEKVLHKILKERILVMDGAMGTMIQGYGLTEEDFRGDRFRDHPSSLKGNNDLLVLTRPEVIREIHRQYLGAGADLIETNTFNANRISLADYGMEELAYEINVAGARLARQVADEFTEKTPDRPRFVIGSMGPTNKTASISPKVEDPGYRAVTFDDLRQIYAEQARGLLEGGADMLMLETVFDTLNAKAGLYGIQEVFRETGKTLPVMVSVTIVDASGRTLSGQTLEAFVISVSHAPLFSIGLNCSLGAKEIEPFVEELSTITPLPVSVHPNAGFPNQFGEYESTPDEMEEVLERLMAGGHVNIIGGCCGTTPAHIRTFAAGAQGKQPRRLPEKKRLLQLSGLEPLKVFEGSNLINIGERTNVAGSRKFARLIREEKYEEALSVARQQVENGAQIIDVSMDDAMLDAKQAMVHFLNLLAADPEIARVPVMIDSSKWEVLEAGLKCLQGKGIVNSISLKEGEEDFLNKAAKIRDYGAAVIVMAFDEEGQATTVERKIEIARRAYRLLTEKIHFPPEDIVFDLNILAIGTGMEEHADYAVNFIEAVKRVKENLPQVHTSGGVSNLSFSFRGHNVIREAMHSSFLYHAVQAGLDMAIVNAGNLPLYDEIPEDLLTLVEDLIFNRRPDATERLLEYAEKAGEKQGKEKEDRDSWRQQPLKERIIHSLVKGIPDFVEEDMNEAITAYPTALEIIEGPMMDGMNIVGDLFGSGKMFLPQVIKSARVMKKAVAVLQPVLEKEKAAGGKRQTAGKVLLATVKGDVHDIGKNIVGIVLQCNNYEIIDLGVMVPAEKILDTARKEKADIIGLSGLITPSLEEMVHVADEMKRKNFTQPLLIGGATTSVLHTAVKIQPHYSRGVVHVKDASKSVTVVSNLLSQAKEEFLKAVDSQYESLRTMNRKIPRNFLPLEKARENRLRLSWEDYSPPVPRRQGILVFDDVHLPTVIPFIDWTFFFHVWEMKGKFPEILDHPVKGEEATRIYQEALDFLDMLVEEKILKIQAMVGLFPAAARGDDIVVFENEERTTILGTLYQLRQQEAKTSSGHNLCLSDFIAPADTKVKDYIGMFAVTAGIGIEHYLEKYRREHDDYSAVMVKALADRLAEAATEWLHLEVRCELWGFETEENLTMEELFQTKYRGIRPAYGYPACPDHAGKKDLFTLLKAEEHIRIHLTENFAMEPGASVSGLIFSHPQADYFDIRKILPDQVEDYARRKNVPVETVRKQLAHLIYNE